MIELLKENREKIPETTPVQRYREVKKEIQMLLKIFSAKLKQHKKEFRKNSRNWGFVGDLGKWRYALQEVA